MAAFGGDFDLQAFKQAFATADDMDAYNRVQALERAVGRVQNFVTRLADAGSKLAGPQRPPLAAGRSPADRAFTTLRDAGVVDARLCRRLTLAQRARSAIEHGYVGTNAGDVHRAAGLVHDAARDFIGRYRVFIAPHLEG